MDLKFWTEIGINALIAFGATFAGVYVAFWKERRRGESEENDQFGQILHGVLNESANNDAMLNEIRNTARAGTTLAHEVFTDTLQVALGSPLFYRKADHSLVLAARLVRTQAGKMSNILSLYRQAAAGGREMTGNDARGLQIRAENLRESIGVLQGLLQAAMNTIGVHVVEDPRLQEVREHLARIYRNEREQLEKAGLWWGPSGGQAPLTQSRLRRGPATVSPAGIGEEALRLWVRGAGIPEVVEVLEQLRGELQGRKVAMEFAVDDQSREGGSGK